MMNFVGVYNAPAMVTMIGLLSGFSACWLAAIGETELAVVALIWAGVFDLFDGMVARRKSRTAKEAAFGVQIDSIVDMASFGIAPVIIAHHLGMNGVAGYAVSVFYVGAAAQRLAYFNVLQGERKQDGPVRFYTGLPVTFAALIFGIAFLFGKILPLAIFDLFLILSFAGVGFLYVFPAKIPKPKGLVYFLMPLLAVIFTVVWLWLSMEG